MLRSQKAWAQQCIGSARFCRLRNLLFSLVLFVVLETFSRNKASCHAKPFRTFTRICLFCLTRCRGFCSDSKRFAAWIQQRLDELLLLRCTCHLGRRGLLRTRAGEAGADVVLGEVGGGEEWRLDGMELGLEGDAAEEATGAEAAAAAEVEDCGGRACDVIAAAMAAAEGGGGDA